MKRTKAGFLRNVRLIFPTLSLQNHRRIPSNHAVWFGRYTNLQAIFLNTKTIFLGNNRGLSTQHKATGAMTQLQCRDSKRRAFTTLMASDVAFCSLAAFSWPHRASNTTDPADDDRWCWSMIQIVSFSPIWLLCLLLITS